MMNEVPFQGEDAASLLTVAGQKFASKDEWTRFLETCFLIAAKDALCAIDDYHSPSVANAVAGQNAQARALAFLFLVKNAKGDGGVQKRSTEAEVSGVGGQGEDEARNVHQAPKRNRGKAAAKTPPPEESH
jgi:hypothetical protein